MEKLSSPRLKKILSKNRTALNTAFAFEKQKNGELDESAFSRYVVQFIEPLVEELAESDDHALEKMVLSLYGRILELMSKNILGSGRYPGMDDALRELLLAYAKFLLDDTQAFFPAAVNGLLKLYGLSSEKAFLWKEKMKDVSVNLSDITGFREAGLAAAWTCGMAVFRERGLEILRASGPLVVEKLLGIDEGQAGKDREKIIDALRENPWAGPLTPGKKNIVARSAGGFTGFDGEFLRPPELFMDEGDIMASDGENHFILHADLFGEMLVPFDLPGKRERARDVKVIKEGSIRAGRVTIPLPERFKMPIKSEVLSGTTCVFSSPRSCKVFIVGLVL